MNALQIALQKSNIRSDRSHQPKEVVPVDIDAIRKALEAIENADDQAEGKTRNRFATLFEIYRDLDSNLSRLSLEQEKYSDEIQNVVKDQLIVLQAAETTRAASVEEVLYKIALWRWDGPNLDGNPNKFTRHDAVMLAAFRDLARLLNDDAVRKPSDLNK